MTDAEVQSRLDNARELLYPKLREFIEGFAQQTEISNPEAAVICLPAMLQYVVELGGAVSMTVTQRAVEFKFVFEPRKPRRKKHPHAHVA